MNTPEANESLNLLYKDYYPALLKALMPFSSEKNRISQPLLLHSFESYSSSKIKLMIIGEETRTWADGFDRLLGDVRIESPTEYLMNKYNSFGLSAKDHSSPFWSFAHNLNNRINPQNDKRNFIWNNISKVDVNGKRVSPQVAAELMKLNNVVYREIDLLKPEAVIFLTGYGYDNYIKETFPGIEFIKHTPGKVAALKHPVLPPKTFRTFHPKYLRISGKEKDVLEILVKECLN